jgi:hypothetical protein
MEGGREEEREGGREGGREGRREGDYLEHVNRQCAAMLRAHGGHISQMQRAKVESEPAILPLPRGARYHLRHGRCGGVGRSTAGKGQQGRRTQDFGGRAGEPNEFRNKIHASGWQGSMRRCG